MAQVTVNLPIIKDWRTTLFGIVTAIGGAVMQWYQTGHVTWQGAVTCALWAVFCYLVPDAKSNTNMQMQIESLLDAVTKAQIPPPEVIARTAAPATDASGLPSAPSA